MAVRLRIGGGPFRSVNAHDVRLGGIADGKRRSTFRCDKTYFGYKAHLAVDEGSDLIRQAEMTSADLHDSQRGEAMIQGDAEVYYADKAYDSKGLREKLASLGIDDKIAYKAKRNKPLKNWQKWFNTTASSVRSGVERANATMKNWFGTARVR